MINLFLDIETIPSGDKVLELPHPATMSKADTIEKWKKEKMPAEIEKEFRKRAVISHQCKVISIGYGANNWEVVRYSEKNEKKPIFELNEFIKSIDDPAQNINWIGWNIRKFDLPILRMRAGKYGCDELKWAIPFKRYDNRIIDLMDIFTPSDMTSMKTACDFFDIKHKEELDGSMVYDAYLQEKHDLIKEYNLKEIIVLKQLHKILI